jgi:Zn-dependent M28 family amino/carboxypeptidase
MHQRKRSPWLTLALATTAAAVLAATMPASLATAAPPRCEHSNNNTHRKLLDCVTVDGVSAHLAALQKIAEANDDPYYPGSRAAGTKGYADSVAYVSGLLEDAGYQVTLDEFEFEFYFPATLQQLEPTAATYETGPFTGSGFGDVTAAVTPVDINLTPPRASTSGCESADFAGFPAGNIALIQRGSCDFAVKASNAAAAGASAVVIFNQGDTELREGLIIGTLGDVSASIPVVGASFADGVMLSQPGSTARVHVIEPETRTDVNVIAELPGIRQDNVVMSGAHLDSVGEGPGINDNGSGSAAILETALMMANTRPMNTLRFAFWGAEESGLLGSTAYVEGLSAAEKEEIALYLNYDMVGSPNYVFGIYDADRSTFPAEGVPIPPGSQAIEDVYEQYYTLIGEPFTDTEYSGRSDYEAFINSGIPAGGLFTGAEGIKSPQEAAIFGGTAGDQYDSCYHLACDTEGNINRHALEVNSDLIAFAQLTFAYSTQAVNGVPGTPVPGGIRLPKANQPAGPGLSKARANYDSTKRTDWALPGPAR